MTTTTTTTEDTMSKTTDPDAMTRAEFARWVEAECLAVLQEYRHDGWTAPEMAEHTDIDADAARRALNRLAVRGDCRRYTGYGGGTKFAAAAAAGVAR